MALTKVNTDLLEDGGKLDGIEAGADVTDTTNVTAAGALMDSELTSEASVKALNQGVATTDSPTFAGLDVNGTGSVIELSQSAAGSATYYTMDNTVETGGKRWRFGYSGGSSDKGSFSFYNQTDNNLALLLASSGATFSGSVGIGCTPTSPLHIKSATNVNVRFDDSGSSSHTWYMNDAQNLYIPNVQLASTHTFYANGQRKVDIDASGNVGIGTSSPSAKVDIFDSGAGNANLSGLELTNYDYGAGETGQSISIEALVRNDGGGTSPLGKIIFGKDSDYSSAAARDGNIQFYTNQSNVVTEAMRISSTGAATFSSSVTADGQLTSARGSDTGTYGFRHEGAGKYMRMGVANASFAYFETDANGGFSFEGNVTVPNQILHAGDTDTYMQFHAVNEWRVVAGGYERFAIGPHVVVNEDSHDSDFRVESNSNTHMLFVDGGNDRIGFGLSNPAQSFAVQFATADRVGTFYDTGTNGNAMHNGAAVLGVSRSSNGSTSLHGPIFEVGRDNGLNATYNVSDRFLTVRSDSTVINEDSQNYDFRVESDAYAEALFLSADVNRFSLGQDNSAPWGQTSGQGSFNYRMVEQSGAFSTDSATGYANIYINKFNLPTDDTRAIAFYGNGTQVGTITVSTSATAYNTSSDQRLKENIADADDAGSKIDSIQVRKFDWKADGSHQDYGMVAQELQTVAPEAVSAPENPDEMMGVDYSKLVPMLIKEIQSLRNRVAQLEE